MVKRLSRKLAHSLGVLVPAYRLYSRTRDFHPSVLVQNRRLRLQGAPDGLPVPPLKLIYDVAGCYRIGDYLHVGAVTAHEIRDMIEEAGIQFSRTGPMLEWGCGCGRVLRCWKDAGIEVHGCDYNPAMVRWCQENLAFAHCVQNQLDPPLPYASGSMGLIYAISVFTHLPERLQHAWMEELTRILRPGGLLLFSTHGDNSLGVLSPPEQAIYAAGRLVVRDSDLAGSNLCNAYHPPSYVRNVLGRNLSVLGFRPAAIGQDLYLLQKPL